MGRMERFLGYSELADTGRHVWKTLLAEFLGTCFLVIIGPGSSVSGWDDTYAPTMVQIALAAGIAVATIVLCIGHVSGGHINPAVTCAMLVTGKMGLLRSLLYIVAQVLGAIVGSGILKALTPEDMQGGLGQTLVQSKLNPVQGFGVEFLITFILVLTVFAVCDERRGDLKGSAPLAIGLCVTACHLFALQYTGSSMNPARSLAPAIMTGQWGHHWVYWLGPCVGGMTAGIVYQAAFVAKAPAGKDEVHFMQLSTVDGAGEKDGASKGGDLGC